jgi:dihydroorotate dehydrogenase
VGKTELSKKPLKETSAKVFEINLAHPNSGMKSLVYEDIETSVAICKNIKNKIKDRPLIAKIGYYKHTEQLKEFMDKTRGIIQGISSTNTLAMPIVDEKGAMCFPERPKAGVSGNAVRTLSMLQAKQIVAYRNLLGIHDLIVIGIGGVMNPEHINQYLSVGVDAVQSAVGVWVDPLIAYKYKQTLQ